MTATAGPSGPRDTDLGLLWRRAAGAVLLVLTLAFGSFLTFGSGAELWLSNTVEAWGGFGARLPDRPLEQIDHAKYWHTPEQQQRGNRIIDIVGNVLLLFPLVLSVVLLWPGLRWWHVAVAAFGVSSAIELTQLFLVSGRQAQVRDVVLNTAGAVLAYALIRAAGRLVRSALGRRAARAA